MDHYRFFSAMKWKIGFHYFRVKFLLLYMVLALGIFTVILFVMFYGSQYMFSRLMQKYIDRFHKMIK